MKLNQLVYLLSQLISSLLSYVLFTFLCDSVYAHMLVCVTVLGYAMHKHVEAKGHFIHLLQILFTLHLETGSLSGLGPIR